jgi:hypothetical protein
MKIERQTVKFTQSLENLAKKASGVGDMVLGTKYRPSIRG